MARKTAPLEPVNERERDTPQPPLQVPPPAARRGPGRPSNAERAARATATQPEPPKVPEPKLTPQDMLPVTALVLKLVAIGVKGDAPTPEEIALVNDPMTAVANKYQIVSRWAPELALLGALMIVAAGMRERANARRDVERPKPELVATFGRPPE